MLNPDADPEHCGVEDGEDHSDPDKAEDHGGHDDFGHDEHVVGVREVFEGPAHDQRLIQDDDACGPAAAQAAEDPDAEDLEDSKDGEPAEGDGLVIAEKDEAGDPRAVHHDHDGVVRCADFMRALFHQFRGVAFGDHKLAEALDDDEAEEEDCCGLHYAAFALMWSGKKDAVKPGPRAQDIICPVLPEAITDFRTKRTVGADMFPAARRV